MKSKITICLLVLVAVFVFGNTNAQQTINNVQIGTNAPASGVNILTNFPGYTGGWARGFSLSNQTGATPFIEFGALGSSASGASSFTYGYIGKDYTARHMTFYPNYNIEMGRTGSSLSVLGSQSIAGSLSVAGNINMGGTSVIQSPTQLLMQSGSSYYNLTPAGASVRAGTGAGTFSVAGNEYVSGSLTVIGNLNMGGASQIQSPTQIVLSSGGSYVSLLPTAAAIKVNSTGTGTLTVAGSQNLTGTLTVGGNLIIPTASNEYVKIGSVGTPNIAGYKLFVDQGILTEKVKVAVATNPAQWADYVFAEDYKLMPLKYVEQYIKSNKHLPKVPSAEEMVREGNDLHKTDVMLLEKIEELTLYIIELKKEIDLLKK